MVLLRKVIVCFRSYLLIISYYFSVSFHILLYAPLSTKPNKDLGMVWRLPHMGQGIGVEYTVACHSMSRASKTWPQSSHLNFFFPLIIVVNVSKLDMLCKDRLFIINVQGKRKKNIVLSFKFNICRNKSSCVWAHITDYLDLPIFIHSCRLPHVFLRIVVCHQEYQ